MCGNRTVHHVWFGNFQKFLSFFTFAVLIIWSSFCTIWPFPPFPTHAFIFCTCFIHTGVAGVCWSLCQLSGGERMGTRWIGHPPITVLTESQTTIHTLNHTDSSPGHSGGNWSARYTRRTCKLCTERPETRFEPQTFLLGSAETETDTIFVME